MDQDVGHTETSGTPFQISIPYATRRRCAYDLESYRPQNSQSQAAP